MSAKKISVGIVGATGYMGGEVIRVLLEHPHASISWVTSRSSDNLDYAHPNLYGENVPVIRVEDATPVDVAFFAVPTRSVSALAPDLMSSGCKVIDLGAEFRLKDRQTWERVYKGEHPCWPLAEEAIYGIPELYREKIKEARVIANPGCYSSAAIFGLAPLIAEGLIDEQKIIVDGLSGTAGAGAELDRSVHHPEITNNIVLYNVIDHRHSYEIEQELDLVRRRAGRAGEAQPLTVHFTSAYVPISRGIVAVCHAFPKRPTNRDKLLNLFRSFYAGEEFVKVFDAPYEKGASWQYRPYPWVSATSGTNYCYVGLDYDEQRGRIVVMSVLDSVGKGGAHAGVQNMNLLFGLPEDCGLRRRGSHPY